MIKDIQGLHHVTSLASDAARNNAFFTDVLGLRRVKKTVNFDAPDVYHLYYGDGQGTPGSVMTYFPFPHAKRGTPGAGEAGTTAFAIPEGSLGYWKERLAKKGVQNLKEATRWGEARLHFQGPDADDFALVEKPCDIRTPWTGGDVPADEAIRGFHSATLRLDDGAAMAELLTFMGYQKVNEAPGAVRFALDDANGAGVIDLDIDPTAAPAQQGAGSVHHVAFAVPTRAAQQTVRQALLDTGYAVTPVIDRNYFWAIYFRTPGGVLFEVATDEPGFDHDEQAPELGQALMLPPQHEHLRQHLETVLPPL